MPIIVACPSCAGQLRVADDLVGRKVRCPACGTTFDAAARPVVPPVRERAAPEEKVEGWKFLDLELSDNPTAGKAADPDGNGPVPVPPVPPRPQPRPRSEDEYEEDESRCPSCGQPSRPGTRRCQHCGERLDGERGDDDYPLDRLRRRPRRRDTEPHRADFVLAMGIVSLALLAFCAFVSVVPGLIAWICGQADLRKMRDGVMDTDGKGSTQAGWICGMIGTGLSVLTWLSCGTFVGIVWYGEIQASKNLNRPPVTAPAPVGPGR